MTTKEAFAELISKRKWYGDLGITTEAANTLAKRFRDGGPVSTDKIEELLEKAGYKTIVEQQWLYKPADLRDPAPDDSPVLLADLDITGFIDWQFTVRHMWPEDLEFERQTKYYREYLQRVKAQEYEKRPTQYV